MNKSIPPQITKISYRPFYSILSLLSGLLITACTERIDISTDNAAPQVVITGCITTDTMVHTVTISQTVGYFGTESPKTFDNARVKINGEELQYFGSGVYGTDPSFFGVPGTKYTLDVEVDVEGEGRLSHYTAEALMPRIHKLDSISLIPARSDMDPNDPRWWLLVHFQDIKNVPNLFGAHLYICGLKYSDFLRRYYLNENEEMAADGQYIRFPLIPEYTIRHEMRWNNDEKILVYTGDTLTVELNMLDRPYFDYLRAAKLEISGSNPIFAGPPANVPGNIQGGALGIFGAYTTSRRHLVLDKRYGLPDPPQE